MQTSLKKECQNYRKYKKDNDAIIAERRRLYGIWKEAEKERIRPGDQFGEKQKKATIQEAKRRYDDFEARIRDKEKIASRNSARDRRLLLMGKINSAAEGANRKAKNMSVPKKDVKGVYQKYGDTACDFDKRKFYDTSRFGSIVYGYLKAAMGEKTDEKTLREIERELNQKEAEEKRKRNTYPNIGGVLNYETL